jgi:hypothetical protein
MLKVTNAAKKGRVKIQGLIVTFAADKAWIDQFLLPKYNPSI